MDTKESIEKRKKSPQLQDTEGISVAPVAGFNAETSKDLGKRDMQEGEEVAPAGASLLPDDSDFAVPTDQGPMLSDHGEEGSRSDHLKLDHRLGDAVARLRNRFWGQRKKDRSVPGDDFVI